MWIGFESFFGFYGARELGRGWVGVCMRGASYFGGLWGGFTPPLVSGGFHIFWGWGCNKAAPPYCQSVYILVFISNFRNIWLRS